ncbi:MAG: TolC family protein, partial [bacterium]
MSVMKRKSWLAGIVLGMAGTLAAGDAGTGVTLDGCIATALKANPDVKSATARVKAAQAAVREASSAYYPSLGLAGNWTRTDNPPQAFFMSLNQRRASLQKDFNNPEDTENLRGSVVAQWRLYDGGRREADRRAASGGAEAAEQLMDSVHNDLAYQVIRAYYGVLQVRDMMKVREEEVASITGTLRLAAERHKAGAALKSDVLNLEVQMAQSNEELIRARNSLQFAVAVLNTAMGQSRVGMNDVAGMTAGDLAPVATNTASCGVESRPELRMAGAQVKASEAMVSRDRREYLPVVSAFGSLDWDSETFSGPERSYLAGAAVELNIFDGFRTRAGVAKAAAGADQARAEAEKLASALLLDLTRARLNEQEARERLEVAGKSLASAVESLRITRERYSQGAADITELMAAQVALTANQTRQVAGRYDALSARADVERAEGVLGGK